MAQMAATTASAIAIVPVDVREAKRIPTSGEPLVLQPVRGYDVVYYRGVPCEALDESETPDAAALVGFVHVAQPVQLGYLKDRGVALVAVVTHGVVPMLCYPEYACAPTPGEPLMFNGTPIGTFITETSAWFSALPTS